METQKFKGDAIELKMESVAIPVFDLTDSALDQFYQNGFESTPFLLMLYDEKRIPFSERVGRDAFVVFIIETFKNFPFIGTFDTYLFIIRAIFGDLSTIVFDVPVPGKLSIEVNATSSLEFDFIAVEPDGVGGFNIYEVTDSTGLTLGFRGIAGIDTEYELELLFSEIMPAGITPDIALSFFERSDFVAEDDLGNLDQVIDYLGNQIVFSEIGG